jgi:hypothetical protein
MIGIERDGKHLFGRTEIADRERLITAVYSEYVIWQNNGGRTITNQLRRPNVHFFALHLFAISVYA